MENVIEVKTRETRDGWGNKGVCTYKRMSEWFDNEGNWSDSWATVYVTDTSTGHGWGGRMSKTIWDKDTEKAEGLVSAKVTVKISETGKVQRFTVHERRFTWVKSDYNGYEAGGWAVVDMIADMYGDKIDWFRIQWYVDGMPIMQDTPYKNYSV